MIPFPPRDPDSKPNPIFVDALQRGLRSLWDGESYDSTKKEHICNTLEHCEALCRVISKRLDGCFTFYGWLCWFHQEFCDESNQEIQAARKAWMLDLIEEFN